VSVPSNTGTPIEWASRIVEAWNASRESILGAGRLLIEAKAALPHGEFEAMVETELPFGPRTARRLMAIANDERLANRTHASVLPPSWMTLYEFTKLNDEQFGAALEQGVIRPDMQRADITRFRDEWNQPAPSPVDPAETCRTEDLNLLIEKGLKFGTIYADPPWLYGNQGTRAATSNHYSGMTPTEVAEMPIAELAANQAHLHLWTTNGFLFDARTVLEAWGFEYKSCFIWAKPEMGIGNYWRVSHEFMLLGVRGGLTFADRGLKSWQEISRSQHSAKPEEVRAAIERAGQGPRLELFARRVAPGWTVWGNDIERSLFTQLAEEVAA
jgi:N6-adenosine-specific RNA methylase IME4